MTKSIKIENPQQQLVPLERSETISWIGYVQRPINQKTQVRNVYLDGVIATTTQQIPIPLWNWERTDVTWYTYTKTGNHDFTRWSTDSIIVPANWTYMITMRASINDLFWDLWLTNYQITKNWNFFLMDWRFTMIYYESMNITSIENLNKWDVLKIMINIDNETNIRTLDVKFTLTKLS